MESTTDTKGTEMTYQVRLNVRGCTTEQYAAVALKCAANDGINGKVVRVTRTRKGATVTVAA